MDNYIFNQMIQTKNKRTYKIIISILLLSLASYLITNYTSLPTFSFAGIRNLYTTNTVRMSDVAKYCLKAQYPITADQRSTNKQYNNNLVSYLKANATYLFPAAKNGQIGNVFRQLQVNGSGTFVFIAPFLIGLALLLVSIPCIGCCCCCPQTCPPKCCRDNNPNYSNGELACPTIFVLLLSVLILGSTIPLMTNSGSFFEDFSCLSTRFLDNFANGNVTSSQTSFFSGINVIRTQLKDVLMPKITNVQTEINKLKQTASSVMDVAITDTNAALDTMKSMPIGGTDYTQFTLSYNTPLTQSSATDSLNSVLGPQIGTFGSNSSLLGNLYDYVSTNIYTSILTIVTAATTVSSSLTIADIGSQITAADVILKKVQDNINELSSTIINPALNFATMFDSYNVKYSLYFYGLIIGMTVGTLMGVIFIKCFDMIKARFCLYFICLIFFFICLLTFGLTILLSIFVPSLYYTCQYFQNTFTSPFQWTSTILTMQGSEYADLANHFSQCFGGTKDFITNVSPTLSGQISNLKKAVFNSHLYDFPAMTVQINARLLAMNSLIDSVGNGAIPDFDISSALGLTQIDQFNKIASKSLYTTACISTSFNIFYQDVWVPGISSTYQTYVSCLNKTSIDSTTCGNAIQTTASCPFSRCINSFSIISQYYRTGNIANLVPNANTRYGTCPLFTTHLTNFHTNYVQHVVDSIGNTVSDAADSTKLAGRYITKVKTPLQSLRDKFNTDVKTLFTDVYTQLTTTHGLQTVFDTDTGVLKGLDCGLLGQSGQKMKESLCITSFNKVFLAFVLFAIISNASFILICCLVCFNVRHYMKSNESHTNKLKAPSINKIYPLRQDSNVDIKMMS